MKHMGPVRLLIIRFQHAECGRIDVLISFGDAIDVVGSMTRFGLKCDEDASNYWISRGFCSSLSVPQDIVTVTLKKRKQTGHSALVEC